MNKERMADVADAIFGFMRKRQNEPWTSSSLPEVVAYGIEAALAWEPEGEVLTAAQIMGPLCSRPDPEGDVITGTHQHRYEKELEKQLDTVLRYVELQNSWIAQDNREDLVEFQNLGLEVQMIAEVRKIRRGIE